MDTRAVIQGLESGIIGSLGIDVYENEGPLFFKDTSAMRSSDRMRYWDQQMGVLLSLPNVLVTPHSAFLTDEALANIASAWRAAGCKALRLTRPRAQTPRWTTSPPFRAASRCSTP